MQPFTQGPPFIEDSNGVAVGLRLRIIVLVLHLLDVCDCVFGGDVAPVSDKEHLYIQDAAFCGGVVFDCDVVSDDPKSL